MESKPKTTGIPQAQMPGIRFDEETARRPNRWVSIVILVTAAGLVAAAIIVAVGVGDSFTGPLTDAVVDWGSSLFG